eukprot:765143-Hanusia_phi.AAC.2
MLISSIVLAMSIQPDLDPNLTVNRYPSLLQFSPALLLLSFLFAPGPSLLPAPDMLSRLSNRLTSYQAAYPGLSCETTPVLKTPTQTLHTLEPPGDMSVESTLKSTQYPWRRRGWGHKITGWGWVVGIPEVYNVSRGGGKGRWWGPIMENEGWGLSELCMWWRPRLMAGRREEEEEEEARGEGQSR